MKKKSFDQALLFFEKQIKRFPEEEDFFREYKAFVYEAEKKFFFAIEELEKIKSVKPFVQQKIQKLRERQSQQPGF